MTLNLDALQTAIEDDIKAAFPALQTVEFYAEYRKGMALPALLLELSEWQRFDDPDAGTEQLSVTARFEARIIIKGVQTKTAKKGVRILAASLGAFLHHRRWTDPDDATKKLRTGPAEFLGAYPDEFDPELDQFEVWRIEWDQVLHLGENVWEKGADFLPDYVFVGITPDVGPEHLDDYVEITGGDYLSVIVNETTLAG